MGPVSWAARRSGPSGPVPARAGRQERCRVAGRGRAARARARRAGRRRRRRIGERARGGLERRTPAAPAADRTRPLRRSCDWGGVSTGCDELGGRVLGLGHRSNGSGSTARSRCRRPLRLDRPLGLERRSAAGCSARSTTRSNVERRRRPSRTPLGDSPVVSLERGVGGDVGSALSVADRCRRIGSTVVSVGSAVSDVRHECVGRGGRPSRPIHDACRAPRCRGRSSPVRSPSSPVASIGPYSVAGSTTSTR